MDAAPRKAEAVQDRSEPDRRDREDAPHVGEFSESPDKLTSHEISQSVAVKIYSLVTSNIKKCRDMAKARFFRRSWIPLLPLVGERYPEQPT